MTSNITAFDDPVMLRDRWRESCWRGVAGDELVALEQWLEVSDHWAALAASSPGGHDPRLWLAGAELERIARWPLVRVGRDAMVADFDRPVVFATASGDEIEIALARQGVATDRLRFSPSAAARDEALAHARSCTGTPVQRARSCLNAAWAARATRGAESAHWGREGLSILGPVSVEDPREVRELALHLLQQASEFLPWPEKSVMAQSMLAMLKPGEHPAWRARILRRLWSAALEHDAGEADAILAQAVDAAVATGRGRSMMEVASGLISAVQFQDLAPRAAVDPLRRLALGIDARENPLAAMNVKSFLIEVLVSDGDDSAAYSIGQEALATLNDLRSGRITPLTRSMFADDWAMLWAGLAVNVATSAANLERFDEAARLADESLQVHRTHGFNLMAATTALELASYRQGTGDATRALDALTLAGDLASEEQDRDLQARALARRPQVVLDRDGSVAAIEACLVAEQRIMELAEGLEDPLERGLVVWEALDVKRLRAEILADSGALRQALGCLDGVADEFNAQGYSTQASEVLVVTGHYQVALGQAEAAEAAWRRAIDLADTDDDQWIRREAATVLADWLTGQGRDAEAEALRRHHCADPESQS